MTHGPRSRHRWPSNTKKRGIPHWVPRFLRPCLSFRKVSRIERLSTPASVGIRFVAIRVSRPLHPAWKVAVVRPLVESLTVRRIMRAPERRRERNQSIKIVASVPTRVFDDDSGARERIRIGVMMFEIRQSEPLRHFLQSVSAKTVVERTAQRQRVEPLIMGDWQIEPPAGLLQHRPVEAHVVSHQRHPRQCLRSS